MRVGRAELDLLLPAGHSLKDKRQILRSLLERLRHRFNIAAAEIGAQDKLNRAEIGLACVSGDAGHARRVIEEAVRFVENDGRCEIAGRRIEVE